MLIRIPSPFVAPPVDPPPDFGVGGADGQHVAGDGLHLVPTVRTGRDPQGVLTQQGQGLRRLPFGKRLVDAQVGELEPGGVPLGIALLPPSLPRSTA